jgi:hypothetical protein
MRTGVIKAVVVDTLELRRSRLRQKVELLLDGDDHEHLALADDLGVLPPLRIQANLVADSLHRDRDPVGNLQCPTAEREEGGA